MRKSIGKLIGLILLIGLAGLFTTASAKTHVLLIGIGAYQFPAPAHNFSSLSGPPEDLNLMQNLLKDQFKVEDIVVLKNEAATRKGMLDAFISLKSGSEPGDILFIYFSGHGTQVQDGNGDEADGFDEAMVAYDFKYGTSQGLIIDDELAGIFERLNDRFVIAVMDCCHSGTAARSIFGKNYRARYVPPAEISNFTPPFTIGINPGLHDNQVPANHVYLGAAQDAQQAMEVFFDQEKECHGIFTFHFVKGMQGDADSNYNGVITYREIYDYCKTMVSLERADQIPSIAVKDRDFLDQPFLGKTPAALKHPDFAKTGKNRVRLEGVSSLPYHSPGFAVEYTGSGQEWDYLIKKQNGLYELYDKSGDPVYRSPLPDNAWKRLEAAVLKDSLKKLQNRDRDFNLSVEAGGVGRYYFREGEKIKYHIRSEANCYLFWLNIDPEGNITVLLPNREQGGKNNFLQKGKTYTIPGEEFDTGFEFEAGPPFGKESFKLIAFKNNIDISKLFSGCVNETAYYFSLAPQKDCNSWAFYHRLASLLSGSRDWADTVMDIETIPTGR